MDQSVITTWKHPLALFIDEMANNGKGHTASMAPHYAAFQLGVKMSVGFYESPYKSGNPHQP
jgi:hypothetical protein